LERVLWAVQSVARQPRRAGRSTGHFVLNDNGLHPVAPGRIRGLFGGVDFFWPRPSVGRPTSRPPPSTRSMPAHRRRRTMRAPASCSADAWAAAVAGAAHSARFPTPRPDAAAGAPVSSVPPWHTLARHLAPPPSARPRVSGTRKLTCAPSTIGWLASAHALAVRSGCASRKAAQQGGARASQT